MLSHGIALIRFAFKTQTESSSVDLNRLLHFKNQNFDTKLLKHYFDRNFPQNVG